MTDDRPTTIDVGFWPEIPYPNISRFEQRSNPARAKTMFEANAAAIQELERLMKILRDPCWMLINRGDYDAVVSFLEKPERTVQYRGSSQCRVCGISNGSQDWFRGGFRYPQGYLHYVTEHGFVPPEELIKAATAAS